jgi:hypothetical protein
MLISLHRVQSLSSKRKNNLETAKRYYQFLDDTESEERWVAEKLEEVKSPNVGKDLNAGLVLLKKHEVRHSGLLSFWSFVNLDFFHSGLMSFITFCVVKV